MTPEQFAYWLQGFVELNGYVPTVEQWELIKSHLNTVFTKVTPMLKYAPPQENLRGGLIDQMAVRPQVIC